MCSRMAIRIIQDKIEAFKLSTTINKKKTNDIRKYNLKVIKETLNKETSMKIARRTLGFGSKQTVFFKTGTRSHYK